MAETDKDTEQWYVLGCLSVHHEEKVRDALRQAGFRSYVPMKYEVKTVRRQKQRTMVPAITGLIFARGSEEALKEYIQHQSRESIYMRKSTFSNKQDYLTVADYAMERFIEFTNIQQENISFFRPEELNLKEGETIRIKSGLYNGYEGTILRIKGKRNKHLVVQIPGVIIAAVEIEPEVVELISSEEGGRRKEEGEHAANKKEREIRELPSKDVDGDKKYLLETAEWLLANQVDKDVPKMEYNLKLFELKRTRARLLKFKGFTPLTEAELALPMYLSALILAEGIPEAKERLMKATEKLKETCKFKQRCQEALRVESEE
jgi:transcription antitermination factor NusG